MPKEQIVFVDENGRPTGQTGPKLESHTANTKLHLAFSCYVFNDDGKFLLTQRALSKKVWPGVWTNSFCGHPMPGEKIEDAIERRAHDELGMTVGNITSILPDYRYKTPPYNGIIENEFCPVYAARATSTITPNPSEVESFDWMPWPEYILRVQQEPDTFSYWAKDQLPRLNDSPAFNAFIAGITQPN